MFSKCINLLTLVRSFSVIHAYHPLNVLNTVKVLPYIRKVIKLGKEEKKTNSRAMWPEILTIMEQNSSNTKRFLVYIFGFQQRWIFGVGLSGLTLRLVWQVNSMEGTWCFGNARTANTLDQCFSTFVRRRPGKFFFHKTRARSQQIYS
jgi:hypothetical protein